MRSSVEWRSSSWRLSSLAFSSIPSIVGCSWSTMPSRIAVIFSASQRSFRTFSLASQASFSFLSSRLYFSAYSTLTFSKAASLSLAALAASANFSDRDCLSARRLDMVDTYFSIRRAIVCVSCSSLRAASSFARCSPAYKVRRSYSRICFMSKSVCCWSSRSSSSSISRAFTSAPSPA